MQPTFWRPRDGATTYEFDLVGLYRGATPDVDETQFFFRYDYLMERTGDPGLVGWFAVEVDDPEHADQIAQAIDRQFANSAAETKTSTEKAFMQSFAHQVGDTGAMMTAIAAIVFFIILLIVGNTMAQSVRERTAELGVLRRSASARISVMGLCSAKRCCSPGSRASSVCSSRSPCPASPRPSRRSCRSSTCHCARSSWASRSRRSSAWRAADCLPSWRSGSIVEALRKR
jgi:hypothetical protein